MRGEISGFKRAASGHLYIGAQGRGGGARRGLLARHGRQLGIAPEDGLEVICTGKLTTYPGRSKYQIVVESMELAGEGALLKLLEERRKKLAAEGLFDEARKKPLPFLPDVIGVVTSPTGAVIRDILHRLADRFPRHVLIWPVLVQGEGAARQVAAAIAGFNRDHARRARAAAGRADRRARRRQPGGSLGFQRGDRGARGGGVEIPLISAVGHETDTTLIDFAADRRAPTPTAAAEMAVPVRADLQAMVLDNARRLVSGMQRMMEDRRVRLEGLVRGLPDLDSLLGTWNQRLDTANERLGNAARRLLRDRQQQVMHWAAQIKPPNQILANSRRRFDREIEALGGAMRRYLRGKADRYDEIGGRFGPALVARPMRDAGQRLTALGDLLESLSFHRVLERGYTLVRDAAGRPVAAAAALAPGDAISLEFADGAVGAQVTGGAAFEGEPTASRETEKKEPAKRDGRQGRLL